MEIVEVLGRDVAAAFAPLLGALPRRVEYGESAAVALAQAMREEARGRRVAVLFDVRTRQAAGDRCLRALVESGWAVTERLVDDPADGGWPVCDDVTQERLQRSMPDVDAFVAIGSGVVNDLTKWLAAEAGRPYGVFATALSMNGYAAANAAATIRGVKTLFRARAPRVIAADPQVVAGAPHEMLAAGLGDLVAKPVSTADWLMNHVLFGEAYAPEIAAIIDRVEPLYLDDPGGVARHEGPALQGLFNALVLSGCAMTLQGSSLPASGGEHLISHTLDMWSGVDGVAHDLHGRQVGVATIFVAALFEQLMEMDAPQWRVPGVEFDRRVWGASAPAVEPEFQKKLEIMGCACAKIVEPGVWDHVRSRIRPGLRGASAIKRCLMSAGAAHRVQDIGCTPARFVRAVQSCAWMRGRFTSIDLALCAGLIPGGELSIVERFLI